MSAQLAEALDRFAVSYRSVLDLEGAVSALHDPQASAYVDICLSVLTRLYKHLEQQETGDGIRQHP